MKCASLIAVVALAGAVAPPTISLDLEGMTNAYKLKTSIEREHSDGLVQNDGTKVKSRQDWTEKCAANLAGVSATECPFPVARAYDHHDGASVSVRCRLYLVDDSNKTISSPVAKPNCERSSVDFTRRSTYLFKYDATDKAGNHAEQVVFALILNDIEAPVFLESKCADAITVEAATDWYLCKQTATDNIDLDRTSNILYRIQEVTTNAFTSTVDMMPNGVWGSYAEAKQVFTPHDASKGRLHTCDAALNCGPLKLGKFLVTAKVTDAAHVYGHNAVDNVATTHVAIVVEDSRAPVIQVNGHSPVYQECILTKYFNGDQADASKPCSAKDTAANQRNPTNLGESDVTIDHDYKCGFNYIDDGADAIDQYDTWARKYTMKYYDAECIDCPEVTAGTAAAAVYKKSSIADRTKTQAVGTTVTDTTFFNMLADSEQTKTRTIKFTAADEKGQAATPAVRLVTTVDTIAPQITLHAAKIVDRYEGNFYEEKNGQKHKLTHKSKSAHGTNDEEILKAIDPASAVSAKDWCDGASDEGRLTIERSWGPRTFNSRVLGHYVRTYTTTDRRNNKATVVRTFNVIDEEKPTIAVIQTSEEQTTGKLVLEATRDLEYTDAGATCNDYVDGELSHAVEVSGEVVNRRIPGTYVIEYSCTDLSGNPADEKYRTVIVQDTTCPTLTLTKSNLQYVEAGFPYVDAGATATDSLDGDITQYIWTDGNTVNHKQAFYSRRSCAEIQASCTTESSNSAMTGVCKSGEYYITTVRKVNGQNRFHRQLVHCWMEKSPAVTFKIFQLSDCESVLNELGMPASTNCHKQDGCELIGMVQNRNVDAQLQQYIKTVKGSGIYDSIRHFDGADVHTTVAGQQKDFGSKGFYGDSTYVCTAKSAADLAAERRTMNGAQWVGDNVEGTNGGQITNAEQGKYVIQFHVSDKAGNTEVSCGGASSPLRTVIVKDTLPPVITLKLQNRLIHQSAGNQVGLNGKVNPAGTKGVNPNLMAETATSNGWIIGAIASAVAGVALLSYGSRSQTVSVPV